MNKLNAVRERLLYSKGLNQVVALTVNNYIKQYVITTKRPKFIERARQIMVEISNLNNLDLRHRLDARLNSLSVGLNIDFSLHYGLSDVTGVTFREIYGDIEGLSDDCLDEGILSFIDRIHMCEHVNDSHTDGVREQLKLLIYILNVLEAIDKQDDFLEIIEGIKQTEYSNHIDLTPYFRMTDTNIYIEYHEPGYVLNPGESYAIPFEVIYGYEIVSDALIFTGKRTENYCRVVTPHNLISEHEYLTGCTWWVNDLTSAVVELLREELLMKYPNLRGEGVLKDSIATLTPSSPITYFDKVLGGYKTGLDANVTISDFVTGWDLDTQLEHYTEACYFRIYRPGDKFYYCKSDNYISEPQLGGNGLHYFRNLEDYTQSLALTSGLVSDFNTLRKEQDQLPTAL